MVTAPCAGTKTSSATLPRRSTKKVSAGSPCRNSSSPSPKPVFEPQPAISSSVSAGRPANTRTSPRTASSVSMLALLGRADGGQLLGDVDPDRTPRDATAAADAAGLAELVVPGPELVGQPLAVARPAGGANRTAVDVRVLDRVAGVPQPYALRVLAGQVGVILDA